MNQLPNLSYALVLDAELLIDLINICRRQDGVIQKRTKATLKCIQYFAIIHSG